MLWRKVIAPPRPQGDNIVKKLLFLFIISVTILLPYQLGAVQLTTGGTIYVPIYRSFYQIYGSNRDSYSLTSTVCVHNTDPKQAVTILCIDYYDSSGKSGKKFLDNPIAIQPWNSKELSIPPSQEPEDFGDNLIVRWKSEKPANSPIVEVLMTGQFLNRGVSFSSRGVEIKE
jgi:hypothetical protein